MKRINNLWEEIISIENLYLADQNARRGKLLSYGVRKHDSDRDANIAELHESLKNKTYKTSEYSVFKIYEPKEREIYRLPYIDRIVHHAIMNVLEPIWVSVFNSSTYSCIKGRGVHSALNAVKKDLASDIEGTKYYLQMDIRKFYFTIDHEILKKIVRKKIKDKNLLLLLDEIISSAPGVPIGNYLSQYFANLYLAYFDHWIKEEKKVKYYRYADDMVVFSSNKESLHQLFQEIKEYLFDNLKLDIKGNHKVCPTDNHGLDFVGYVTRSTHVLMRKGIKQAFARRVAKKANKKTLSAYYGWAKHCNSTHLLKKLKYYDITEQRNTAYNTRFRRRNLSLQL
jgi:RNA-directed DNA polymerase